MIYFITGGSRGIGEAIVLQAIQDGHEVAFGYVRNVEAADAVVEKARRINPELRCRAYQVDVSKSAEVDATVDRVLDEFDEIDVLVNCAGITRDNALVMMSDEEWDVVIGTNLNGAFYCTRKVLMDAMIPQRFGRIIHISSIQHDGGSGQANYAASKAGLHGLSRTIAKEYGRRNVTSNVIVPGFFETDMTRKALPQEVRDFWKVQVPMPKGRMGEMHEMSEVVAFLASPGGGFINGSVIMVTGGLTWTR